MVKDHSDSERGNPLPPHGLLFSINSKGSLYAPSHRQDNTYHSLCYTTRGALAGRRNSSMAPDHEESIRRPIAPWVNTLTTELHLAPGHMIKNTQRKPLHRPLIFYIHHPTYRIYIYTTVIVTPIVEHWLEQETAQWVYHEGSIYNLLMSYIMNFKSATVEFEDFWKRNPHHISRLNVKD